MLRSILSATAITATLVAAAIPARADDFLQQEGDMWRASKLVGVNIYGPDHKKVGDISDVLTGKDGKIGYVVIGVGGFLGIGQKDVAIPFDKVTFSQDPMPGAAGAPDASGSTATGAAPANTGMAPNTNTGVGTPPAATGAGTGAMPAPANSTSSATPAAMARSTAYPDHGMIDYSADQLKSAPTFAYGK